MSFGDDYGKDIGSYVSAVKDAIATMVAAIPEIPINDETNELDDREFKEEYEKIYRDAEEYATTITKALNELPVYYCYHIKNKSVLGKGLKIVRYQTFIKKRNQSQKRREKKRKEIKKKEEDVEDELVNQFNDTMNTSTKRRRVPFVVTTTFVMKFLSQHCDAMGGRRGEGDSTLCACSCIKRKGGALPKRKGGDRVGSEIGRKEDREGKGWEEEDA